MSVSATVHFTLPESPYNLWVRGELDEHVPLPTEGKRVEVIGGEVIVSPGPRAGHSAIVLDVERCVFRAELSDQAFPWRPLHAMDLNLAAIQAGYIPDLVLVDVQTLNDLREANAPHLRPDHVALAIDVGTTYDRKWQGYARVGVGHYLLIDRDPGAAQTTLYTNPDCSSGAYMHAITWEFGEAIKLPEPFGFEIPTGEWEPWA